MRQIEIIEIEELLAGRGPEKIVVHTTGSTGSEKVIELTRENLIASATAAHQFLGAKKGDVWSLLLPTNHIAGINVLARSLILESNLVDVNGKADFTAIVPTQLFQALNGDEKLLTHLQGCKAVLVGGAATSDSLIEQAKRNGITVVTTYGSTETCGGCIYDQTPLAGVEVRVNDEGLLEIKGPMIFTSGWYTTSDLATIEDGKVSILGRNDDVIISGGENISLAQIENLLANKFPNQNFVAVGIPDEKWGSKLCLLSDKDMEISDVSELLSVRIGKHGIPKEFLSPIAIPLKGIGKPDRVAVSQLFLNK